MVSYEDLICHFADIYLETAVKCSICKENYTRTDDNDFLDEFMRYFVLLLSDVEQDQELSIEEIDERLIKRKNQTLDQFRLFMIYEMMEKFSSKAYNELSGTDFSISETPQAYTKRIADITNSFFETSDGSLSAEPEDFLRFIRKQEEKLL